MDLAYETADAAPADRARERELLLRSVAMLERVTEAEPFLRGLRAAEAGGFARRLWIALLDDLGSSDNALADPLRADLISIGLRMARHADRLARGDEGVVPEMIDITQTIARGLQ